MEEEKIKFSLSDIETVSEYLEDDLSKKIFSNRILFSITKDYSYIREIVCSFGEGKRVAEIIKETNAPIGVFGAGAVGEQIATTFGEYITSFIDNNKMGVFAGHNILSLDDFCSEYPNGYIIITPKFHYNDILEQLKEKKINESRILNLGLEYSNLNHKQYFDLPELREEEKDEEVFIDCGGFDGSTTLDFFAWRRAGNKENFDDDYAYVWEPDSKNCSKIRQKLQGVRYQIVDKGTWEGRATIGFCGDGSSNGTVSQMSDKTIELDSIDRICERTSTFIKMDIEGSELEALIGAKNVITQNKPKLAISVYHKPNDIIILPQLIKSMNPSYRLWLRHYSFGANETVLYAL